MLRPLLAAVTGSAALLVLLNRRERKITERLAAAALESLLNAVDANDPETGAHVRRVAACAIVLARAARLPEVEVRSIERVALFHDIGKVHAALFDLVHEPSSLSPDERRLIATHPIRGAEVLEPLATFYPDLPAGVVAHHERWDGSGYPRGLRGEAIPLAARVVAIADTFDAITHGRRYRRGRSLDDAVRAITTGAGTQFDPRFASYVARPSVRRELGRAARDAVRRSRRGNRRAPPSAHMEERAPDITFRWRSESPVQPARDRPH